MVHQAIKVFARIKSAINEEQEHYNVLKKKDYEDLVFSKHIPNIPQVYRFHKIFNHESAQSEIFEVVAKPVISSVIEGFNGTIFAYGQTGSGKTFSINGDSKEYSQRGIIPRSIQYVFSHYNNIPEKPTVYISYMEIYNEIGYDLLSTKQQKVAKTIEELPRVFVMEDKKGDAHIRNLTVYPVTSEEEAMRLLFMGDTNRSIAETPLNEYSSRSHCIFTLYITHRSSQSKHLRSSKLHLVDLAGSERMSKRNCTGTVLNEAKFINLSLHFLQQVILALSDSKRSHIPYRNSMLTHLLKDSLNGNCITCMLATLSIGKNTLQESISTCRFAQKVALITTEPTINEITNPQEEIEFLKNKISDLENHLFKSTSFTKSTTLSLQQKQNCQYEVNNFLNFNKTALVVENDLAQIQFCFDLMKKEVEKTRDDLKTAEDNINKKKNEIKTLTNELVKKNSEIQQLKSQLEHESSKPVEKNSILLLNALHENPSERNFKNSTVDEQNALEYFLSQPEVSYDLNFYKTSLQNKLNLANMLAETIEKCKAKIIGIRNKFDDINENSMEKEALIKDLEEQQNLYRSILLQMKQIQMETSHLEAGLKQAQIRAVYKFKNQITDNEFSNQINSYIEKTLNNSSISLISNNYPVFKNHEICECEDRSPFKPVTNTNANKSSESTKTSLTLKQNTDDEVVMSPKQNNIKKPSEETNTQTPEKQSVKPNHTDINLKKRPAKIDKIELKNFEVVESFCMEPVLRKKSYPIKETISQTLIKYVDPLPDVESNDANHDSNFSKYIVESDTDAFKEFIKTVTLSGVPEIDEEIVSFYRSKFC